MSKAIRFALIAPAAALVASFFACPQATGPTVLLSLSAPSLRNDGTELTVTVSATDDKGAAGTGTATLNVDKGAIDGTLVTAPVSMTLAANGQASVVYSCNLANDIDCTGTATFTVTWGTATNTAALTIRSATGGTDGGGGGGGGGGTDGGYTLSVTSSKAAILLGLNDSADLVATLTNNGTAVPGSSLSLKTNLGNFVGPDGGVQGKAFSYPTNASGTVSWKLKEDGDAGTATVTATATAQSVSGSASVLFIEPGGVNYVGTLCQEPSGPADCRVLGVYGYDYHEAAWISFAVLDANGRPVGPGIPVQFDIPSGPAGTIVEPIAYTNSQGIATARIQAGQVAGSFHVTAVVVSGAIYTTSPGLVVTGVMPSNGGSWVACAFENAPVLGMLDPHEMEIPCSLRLVDRLNNTVGVPQTVWLLTEAGNVTSAVTTQEINPDNPDGTEGTASFSFFTGGLLPLDVAPNAGEPSRADGIFTRNPRDGLVTLIAAAKGEEYYNDDNHNGTHDAAEMFVDQEPPFVDNNDNGVWDPGEKPGQGVARNGTWDRDTTVWMETHVLFTGIPLQSLAHLELNPWAGNCVTGTPLAHGQFAYLTGYFPDLNLNRPAGTISGGAGVSADHTAQVGTVKVIPGSDLADLYGFNVDRVLVDAGGAPCTAANPICHWQTNVDGFPTAATAGSLMPGVLIEVDAPSTPPTSCVPEIVRVDVNVLGWSVRAAAAGGYNL